MMNRRSAHTSQVGDALQYFEAAHRGGRGREASNNTARPVPAFKRTASTSSLRGGSSRGYNPAALFSVAAMATAPVGTTVIEDDEEVEEIDEEMVMLTEFSSSANKDLDQDFDLCDQCTRRRRRARMFQPQQPPASSVLFHFLPLHSTSRSIKSLSLSTLRTPTLPPMNPLLPRTDKGKASGLQSLIGASMIMQV